MKKIVLFFIIIILSLIATSAFAKYLNTAPKTADTDTLFEVFAGDRGDDVARNLQKVNLIRSKNLFSLILRYKNGTVKAGYYHIPAKADSLSIYEILVSGKQEYTKLTIPEGLTVSKIAELLEAHDITVAKDFVMASQNPQLLQKYGIPAKSVEGYLFPDTYYFSRHEDATRVLEILLDQFFSVVENADPDIAKDPQRLFNAVILASIIEKEYRDPAEIKKIAGVFSNRLKIGMGLQSCATIVYITTELMGRPHTGFVTIEDTRIDSPYNTYLWAGLPPGPISNPGHLAFEAALHPDRHGYLYFRLVDEVHGRHFFSKTLDEHAQARRISVKR